MTPAEKQDIYVFLNKEPVGKLFKQFVVEIVARESDIRNIKSEDVKTRVDALQLFTTWVGEILGASDDFIHESEIEELKRSNLESYIFKNN